MMDGGRDVEETRQTLRRIVGTGLKTDEPMSRHTTIGVGGIARFMAAPRSAEQVKKLVSYARGAKLDYVVVGKGSNLIVRDGGFEGVVIKLGPNLSKVRVNKRTVFAEGGASFAKLCRNMTQRGRTGMEFGIGIPGTVGGAVHMNAGAFGGEVGGVLVRVRLVDEQGQLRVVKSSEIQFSYRRTSLPAGAVILSATFACPPGEVDHDTYRRALDRKETQPISERTFGSTFVNPQGDHAARLIEACGLKGARRGGAEISRLHANFIVNPDGEAKASDVEKLIDLMRSEVRKKFGIMLQTEVIIIGNQ